MRRILIVIALAFATPAFAANDVSAAWISRLPAIDYVWDSANPRVEGWPAEGSSVTWQGHIRNLGDSDVTIDYQWRLDGHVERRGVVTIAAGALATVDFPWTWTFARHRLQLELDPANELVETEERNNDLLVYTDSIAAGFWIEQSVWDYLRGRLPQLHAGVASFDDWIQLRMRMFNDMAAVAIYPETPDGVLDRMRVEKIVVVPDGTLPLGVLQNPQGNDLAGQAVHFPDPNDRTIDLEWGYPVKPSLASLQHFNDEAFFDDSLLHELGHARYLVDVYGWYVLDAPPLHVVDLDVPRQNAQVHDVSEHGLMVQHYTFLDRYSAAALNRIAGARATRGHYNEPENLGSFLNDLPAQNRVTFVDAQGRPLANRQVKIYQATAPSGHYDGTNSPYGKHYDNNADLTVQTDANGAALVGRNPFSHGAIVHTNDFSNVTAIMRAGDQYGFLESLDFNLAWWRGEQELANHTVVVGGPNCAVSLQPFVTSPNHESIVATNRVTLTWSRSTMPGTTYTLFVSEDDQKPRVAGTTTATTFTATLGGDVQWWVEAKYPNGCVERSDTGRFSAPRAPRRRAVRP
ncbi:MAG: hypothetical protein JO197_22275 [Acidobacteria bacterium]|nr:hypothetical protein [Acidobacteriota bacterium]MBV9474865.1 hypothetical protein [Acidobacteriota bacterium]